MGCPFCGKEMEQGALSGDGRRWLYWETDKPRGMLDKLAGKGRVQAETFWGEFRLKGEYCPACGKMVLDVRVER